MDKRRVLQIMIAVQAVVLIAGTFVMIRHFDDERAEQEAAERRAQEFDTNAAKVSYRAASLGVGIPDARPTPGDPEDRSGLHYVGLGPKYVQTLSTGRVPYPEDLDTIVCYGITPVGPYLTCSNYINGGDESVAVDVLIVVRDASSGAELGRDAFTDSGGPCEDPAPDPSPSTGFYSGHGVEDQDIVTRTQTILGR